MSICPMLKAIAMFLHKTEEGVKRSLAHQVFCIFVCKCKASRDKNAHTSIIIQNEPSIVFSYFASGWRMDVI